VDNNDIVPIAEPIEVSDGDDRAHNHGGNLPILELSSDGETGCCLRDMTRTLAIHPGAESLRIASLGIVSSGIELDL
jgi:hypothetical protein